MESHKAGENYQIDTNSKIADDDNFINYSYTNTTHSDTTGDKDACLHTSLKKAGKLTFIN